MPRPLHVAKGPSLPFHMPNIQSLVYRPGRQVNNPGESQMDSGGPAFNPIPWPNMAPVLHVLSSNVGTPTGRPIQITNNQTATALQNYMFIAGFAGKSRG